MADHTSSFSFYSGPRSRKGLLIIPMLLKVASSTDHLDGDHVGLI
jgi:hypothetical protein